MKKLTNILILALIFAYPFVIFFGLEKFSVKQISLLLITVFIIRFFLFSTHSGRSNWQLYAGSAIGVAITVIAFISNSSTSLLYYPVAINLLFCLAFTLSMFYPPCMIEIFASKFIKDIDDRRREYLRKVNLVWVIFFAANASLALYTVLLDDMKIWVAYNGFIAYVLVGMLFVAEYAVRKYLQMKQRI